MKNLILRELTRWRRRTPTTTYLTLPPAFSMELPPMSCIGGSPAMTADNAHPKLLVVSLEPLLDRNTFSQQLTYLRDNSPDVIDARVVSWQLDYFDVFPRILEAGRTTTSYWSGITALCRGWWSEPPDDTSVSWSLLGKGYVELPLIPMHATTHTSIAALPESARALVRQLFQERLRVAVQVCRPAAILALGSDPVTETCAALGIDRPEGRVAVAPYDARFGNQKRYELPIFARTMAGGYTLFTRGAPFTNWHRPSRRGIYAIGQALRMRHDQPGRVAAQDHL